MASKQIPSVDGLPLLGRTFDFWGDTFAFYDECHRTGGLVSCSLLGEPYLVATDPAVVKGVLMDHADKFRQGQLVRDTVGQVTERGVFVVSGEQWKTQRMRLQPAFTPRRIQRHVDSMVEITEREADALATQTGQVVDSREFTKQLTLHILARSLFGVEIDSERTATIAEHVPGILNKFDMDSYQFFVPEWIPTAKNRAYRQSLSTLNDLIDELIAERKGRTDIEKVDILSTLLDPDKGERPSDAVIRDELLTFAIAGHDTTANALTAAIHLLGHHPEWQAQVREEARTLFEDGEPSFFELAEMDVTDQVIKETLRLYPPAPHLSRECIENVDIEGYTIREGANVLMPQYVIHRDGQYFDRPEEFHPERWTDGFEESLPEFAYYPFGGGPRNCIGMRFAMTELRVALATLLRQFSFESLSDPELDNRIAITLQPDEPVRVRVSPAE